LKSKLINHRPLLADDYVIITTPMQFFCHNSDKKLITFMTSPSIESVAFLIVVVCLSRQFDVSKSLRWLDWPMTWNSSIFQMKCNSVCGH